MAAVRTFFVFVVMLATSFCSGSDRPTPLLPTAEIRIEQDGRSEKVVLELARTPAEWQKGLMLRQEMPEDAGMLFLFPSDQQGGFWMKDTYLPLDIAYLAADGKVMEIREGVPLNQTILQPERPYRFVVEMNRGWFQRHNMGVGAVVVIPAEVLNPPTPTPAR